MNNSNDLCFLIGPSCRDDAYDTLHACLAAYEVEKTTNPCGQVDSSNLFLYSYCNARQLYSIFECVYDFTVKENDACCLNGTYQ